jgi:hypothetical protein
MVEAMNHEAVDSTSDGSRGNRRRYGSGSCRWSGGLCKRWKVRWMVQTHTKIHGMTRKRN